VDAHDEKGARRQLGRLNAPDPANTAVERRVGNRDVGSRGRRETVKDQGYSTFRYRKGSLYVEDVRLSDLARRYGTPLYVYSGEKIRSQFESFDRAFAAPSPHDLLRHESERKPWPF
jgi:hypothetical protein